MAAVVSFERSGRRMRRALPRTPASPPPLPEKDTAASSSNQKREGLLGTLQRMLDDGPQESEECCIYRVPELLRGLNPTVYTPMAFPIGPIHNKDHGHDDSSEADHPELISNRLFKLQFLKSFFQTHQIDPEALRKIVKRRITDIRGCYAYYDEIFENDDIFIDMILLDCIFIIQLFLEHQSSREGSISMAPLKLEEIASDLILAENQLPFFILQEVYQQFRNLMLPLGLILEELFEDIACMFLKVDSIRNAVDKDVRRFMSRVWISSADDGESLASLEDSIRDAYDKKPFHILDILRASLLPPPGLEVNDTYFPGTMLKRPYNENDIDLQEIMYPTATGLFEAGIQFRIKDDAFSILDISFDVKKGILYIPKLRVGDGTERKFRNLIAFEQSHTKDNQPTSVLRTLRKLSGGVPTQLLQRLMEVEESFIKNHYSYSSMDRQMDWKGILIGNPLQVFAVVYPLVKEYTYITDYMFFMDCLINTPEDVQLLTKAGIIDNWLGSEKNLCELINSMGIHAYHFTGGYLYSHIATELNSYHKKKWNKYKAILKEGYLGHPWAILGLCSAGLLLLLTIAQVVLAGVAL